MARGQTRKHAYDEPKALGAQLIEIELLRLAVAAAVEVEPSVVSLWFYLVSASALFWSCAPEGAWQRVGT